MLKMSLFHDETKIRTLVQDEVSLEQSSFKVKVLYLVRDNSNDHL